MWSRSIEVIGKFARKRLRRAHEEMHRPRTGAGRALYAVRRWARERSASLRRRGHHRSSGDTLLAFYDLASWPITYDIVWFLIAAELARQEKGLAAIHVHFVPTADWGKGNESKQYFEIVDGPARRQRLFDILLPTVALLPTATGVSVAASRSEVSRIVDHQAGQCFPARYSPELPHLPQSFAKEVVDAARTGRPVPSVRAPDGARAWVARWRRGLRDSRPVVTITLRYFDYLPVRNSNLAAWAEFARELEMSGFLVVFVPDTHMTLDPLPENLQGMRLLAEAAWHVHFRLALYEAAYLNLTINTGPAVLCMLSPLCRYIAFKMEVPGENVGSLEYQRSIGLDTRSPFPFATRYQRLVLEPDDLPVIRREFEAMRALIEADPVAAGIAA